MMRRKPAETSDRISSLAARYWRMSYNDFYALLSTPEGVAEVHRDMISMTASLVRQDETPGLAGKVKRFFLGTSKEAEDPGPQSPRD